MVFIILTSENIQYVEEKLLVELLNQFDLEEMCKLAKSFRRIELLCAKIWENDPFYHDNTDLDDISPEAHKYFICKNARNFRSLQIHTSNIKAFNAVTKYLLLSNLDTLNIIMDSELSKLIPARFLIRCPMLEYIRISQPAVGFYLNNIFELESLKRLEISNEDGIDTNDLIQEIITQRGRSIKRLQTEIYEFPPRWLRSSVIEECQNLEALILEVRAYSAPVQREKKISVPKLTSLKNVCIVGCDISILCLKAFVAVCPNLKYLYTQQLDNFNICMLDIMVRRKFEGNNTPLYLFNRRDLKNKSTKIEFI